MSPHVLFWEFDTTALRLHWAFHSTSLATSDTLC
uniref:Uncharacterized protein n=1 Tax=Anguilla anguilla TaxID=7936 RepID=A0A0E9PTK5_ANGAN